MDAALSEALEPVLRDLTRSGSVVPEVRDEQWSDVEGQRTATLYDTDGSGCGVSVMLGASRPENVAGVADQVQEWAFDALGCRGRSTSWPECPAHPNAHPLAAVVRDARAVWVCPKAGHVVSDIGQLPTSAA